MGVWLVPLPLQQPRQCQRGTPLPSHILMVYCPNVDVHDGLNRPLLAAAGVARSSAGLGGGSTGAPAPLPVPTVAVPVRAMGDCRGSITKERQVKIVDRRHGGLLEGGRSDGVAGAVSHALLAASDPGSGAESGEFRVFIFGLA